MLRRALKRLFYRARWSWAGWLEAWRNEASLRQWLWANAISAAAALLLPLGTGERALILALGVLVLAAELMNTAIERAVDLISKDENELARQAKDLASATVAVTAIAAGVAWIVVLADLLA